MAIPEAKVLEVKEASDIADVISTRLPLSRAGSNLKALCPFHEEKTPSFIVSPQRQTYHCFGCGAGGDVYTFLMSHDQLDFPGAVRFLADRVGIVVEEEKKEDQLGYRLVEFARKFYEQSLWKTGEGETARRYLKGRGITEETAKRFDIGYSPAGGRALTDLARQRGLPLPAMEEIGLCLRRDGDHRDRFRRRLMFPISDDRGRTVGFGGRILGEGEPKYLNSPEGPLFSKRKLLYGAHLAREAIRKDGRAIVVEGYTDAILAHQEGVTAVVGCLGTAFTPRQAALIRRFSRQVVLVYDPDSAGVAASERGLDVLLSHGLDVSVAHLPKGKDPFDFLREQGGDAFRQIVSEAEDFFEFKLRSARARHDLRTTRGEAEAAREVMSMVDKVADPIRRDILYRKAAEALGIREDALRSGSPPPARRPKRRLLAPSRAQTEGTEDAIFEILVNRPDLARKAVSAVPLENFSEARRPVAEAVYHQVERDGKVNVATLLIELKEEKYCRVLVEAQEASSSEKDYERTLRDIQIRLQEKAFDDERTQLREEYELARQQGNTERADQIFGRLASCIEEKKRLRG
ncbi:MAG: DNA primase [Planctomycetota bacterium]|nr:DNA primase [Planctomycetota bacterium]